MDCEFLVQSEQEDETLRLMQEHSLEQYDYEASETQLYDIVEDIYVTSVAQLAADPRRI